MRGPLNNRPSEIKKLIALLGLLAIAGCGGGSTSSLSEEAGSLAIVILDAASFNPAVEYGRIEKYRVKIEGPGIAEPIFAEFNGSATEGEVKDVPAGKNRVVSVEAINPNELAIRAGEAAGIAVGSGVTDVDIEMEAVPIFTNLKTSAAVDNTRLAFHLFSDPEHKLIVEDASEKSGALLADIETNRSEIELDRSSGLGSLKPPFLEAGKYSFVVRDVETGRSSKIEVNVLDGTKRRPAPFVAAGRLKAENKVRVTAFK